jgi:hypothetical protein
LILVDPLVEVGSRVAYNRQQTADSRQQTADSRQQTADTRTEILALNLSSSRCGR